MKIMESLPPKLTGLISVDLEIFEGKRTQLHRPIGRFACLSISDGKTVWIITKESDVPKSLARLTKSVWAFHNGSFDVRHLRRWADLPRRSATTFRDTFLTERLLYGGYYDSFELRDLARRYNGRYLEKETRKDFTSGHELTAEMIRYAGLDAYETWHIAHKQEKALRAAWPLWERIECPAFWAALAFKPFHLDIAAWTKLYESYEAKKEKIAKRLGFNPGSWQQTKAALSKRGIIVTNTQEETLTPYKNDPLVAAVLEYREADKRAGTYGRNVIVLLENGNEVYPNFKTIGAETGRMSCTEPNLQNQPREAAYRACYVAKKGHRLLIADYSQQEVRIMAQVSQDPELLGIFERGDDVHQYVADEVSRIVGHPVERRFGKTLNLGLQYGLTPYGFALRTGIDKDLAARLIRGYFQRFSSVQRWIQAARQKGRERGYVETLGGRKVYLNLWQRQWENNALNDVVQGTGGDMIKRAFGLLYDRTGESFPVLGPIHDELVCEARTKEVAKTKKIIVECMTQAFVELCPDVSTRGLVDVHVGLNWASKQGKSK